MIQYRIVVKDINGDYTYGKFAELNADELAAATEMVTNFATWKSFHMFLPDNSPCGIVPANCILAYLESSEN